MLRGRKALPAVVAASAGQRGAVLHGEGLGPAPSALPAAGPSRGSLGRGEAFPEEPLSCQLPPPPWFLTRGQSWWITSPFPALTFGGTWYHWGLGGAGVRSGAPLEGSCQGPRGPEPQPLGGRSPGSDLRGLQTL